MYKGEKFNSISHLVGAVLALMGFGALLAVSIERKDAAMIVSFSIFGLTLVMLYTASTLYHSFYPPKLKKIFQRFDHISIYLLIAGTYTPYMVVSLGDSKGLLMLALIWTLALLGLFLDMVNPRRIELLQISIYLFMGWACLFVYSSLRDAIPTAGMVWLTVGGIAYTIGVVFYILDDMNKLRHAHGIWHLFVLTGSTSHFISIIAYVR